MVAQCGYNEENIPQLQDVSDFLCRIPFCPADFYITAPIILIEIKILFLSSERSNRFRFASRGGAFIVSGFSSWISVPCVPRDAVRPPWQHANVHPRAWRLSRTSGSRPTICRLIFCRFRSADWTCVIRSFWLLHWTTRNGISTKRQEKISHRTLIISMLVTQVLLVHAGIWFVPSRRQAESFWWRFTVIFRGAWILFVWPSCNQTVRSSQDSPGGVLHHAISICLLCFGQLRWRKAKTAVQDSLWKI